MSIFVCSVKHMSKGSGTSAVSHAQYITREGKYAVRQDVAFDGNAALELDYVTRTGKHQERDDLELAFHGNMPSWVANPKDFWRAADTYERKNGRVYTEIMVSLPRELNVEQREKLVKEFVGEELGNRFVYTVAIHNPMALDGGEQPHAHIMFSNRELDGIERSKALFFKRANPEHPELGGAKKSREWSYDSRSNDKINQIRTRWERVANRALEQAGLDERIDRRSLAERGIDRAPEPKMGPEVTQKLKEGRETDIGGEVIELRDYRKKEWEIKQLETELKQKQGQVIDFKQKEEEPENVIILTGKKVENRVFRRTVDLTMYSVKTGEGHKEYYWKVSDKLAFVDEGERIIVKSHRNQTAIKSALQVAKQKGWVEVTAEGERHFRRDSWLQGNLLGLKVTGYQANELDRKELSKLRAEQVSKYQDVKRVKHVEESKQEIVKMPADKVVLQLKGIQREINKKRDVLFTKRDSLEFRELTKDDARSQARDEVGGKRFVNLREEIKVLDSKIQDFEGKSESHNQEMKELGLKAYLPQNIFRVEKRKGELDKEAAELYPSYNKKATEYNDMLSLLDGEKKHLVDKKVKESLAENGVLKQQYEDISKEISLFNREYKQAYDLQEKLQQLGTQEVQIVKDLVKRKGELGVRLANEKAFQKQLQLAELKLKKVHRHGLGIEM